MPRGQVSPQSGSVRTPRRWPLVVTADNRDPSTLKDAKLVNGYAEYDPLTKEWHVYKRFGLSMPLYTAAGNGRGMFQWAGSVKVSYTERSTPVPSFYTTVGAVVVSDPNPPYGYIIGYAPPGTPGTITNSMLAQGQTFAALTWLSATGQLGLELSGFSSDPTTSFISSLSVGATNFLSSSATYTYSGGNAQWVWTVADPFTSGAGNYSVVLNFPNAQTWVPVYTETPQLVIVAGSYANFITQSDPISTHSYLMPGGAGGVCQFCQIPNLPTPIATLTLTSGGTGYTNGTYNLVALTDISSTGHGALADITVSGGVVTAVSLIYGGVGYAVGDTLSASTIGAGTGFVLTVATTGTGAAGLVWGDGTTGTYWTDGTTYAQITAANFPLSIVPGIVYLDGVIYVMDTDGNIWGSGNSDGEEGNDPTQWTALNFIKASIAGDLGVFLARQLNYVVAFMQQTVTFFYDAGNPPPGSALTPYEGAVLNYGCLSAQTVQALDNLLIWVSQDKNGTPQVAVMENLEMRIVSTPQVERLLQSATASTAFFSYTLHTSGHRLYVVTRTDTAVTLVYDIDQKLWYQWAGGGLFNPSYWPIAATSYDSSGNVLAQDVAAGLVYGVSSEYVNDVSLPILWDLYTPNNDAGLHSRRKMLNMMYFNADQQTGSKLYARYSDDDYQSWSDFREVDMSVERPMLDREGTFTRRAYNYRHYSQTALRIRSVELQMDVGVL